MALARRITHVLEVDDRAFQGCARFFVIAKFVSAISNCSRPGTLAMLTQSSPRALPEEIECCRTIRGDNPARRSFLILRAFESVDRIGRGPAQGLIYLIASCNDLIERMIAQVYAILDEVIVAIRTR